MVQNKKLVDELKKYNSALEKHFTNLDFDSLSQLSEGSGNLSQNPEFYSIVATSIMDTKTEMALLRKNLSIEIEGMTKRMIVEQQNNFMEQMNKFYGKTIFELKENLNAHVLEINSNVSELKRDINNFSKKNTDFSKTLESFSGEISEFKQALVSIEEISNRNNNTKDNTKELFSKLSDFEEKIDKLLNEITKKNNFIETNVLGLNKKLVKIETRVLETEEILLNEKTLLEKESNKNKDSFENINSKIIEVENMLFNLESMSKNENKKLNKLEIRDLEEEELLINESALVQKGFSKNRENFTTIENKLTHVNNSLFKLESKSDKNAKNFTTIENKLTHVNNSLFKLESKSDKNAKNINKFEDFRIELEKSNLNKSIQRNNNNNQINNNVVNNVTEKNKIISKQDEIKPKIINLKEKENSILQVKAEVLSKINIKESPEIKIENKIQKTKMDSKIQRILEIDKRLEKLESLR